MNWKGIQYCKREKLKVELAQEKHIIREIGIFLNTNKQKCLVKEKRI